MSADYPSVSSVRRSATVPHQPSSGGGSPSSTKDPLFFHPAAKVVHFSPKAVVPLTASSSSSSPSSHQDFDYPVDTIETLPWRSATERTVALGPLYLETVPGLTAYLKCGGVIHAILKNSQCWCVDGQSTFVLRIRPLTYYRIELPFRTDKDRGYIDQLKAAFPTILRYEITPCPFKRGFTVELPEDALMPKKKRAWRPRERRESAPESPGEGVESVSKRALGASNSMAHRATSSPVVDTCSKGSDTAPRSAGRLRLADTTPQPDVPTLLAKFDANPNSCPPKTPSPVQSGVGTEVMRRKSLPVEEPSPGPVDKEPSLGNGEASSFAPSSPAEVNGWTVPREPAMTAPEASSMPSGVSSTSAVGCEGSRASSDALVSHMPYHSSRANVQNEKDANQEDTGSDNPDISSVPAGQDSSSHTPDGNTESVEKNGGVEKKQVGYEGDSTEAAITALGLDKPKEESTATALKLTSSTKGSTTDVMEPDLSVNRPTATADKPTATRVASASSTKESTAAVTEPDLSVNGPTASAMKSTATYLESASSNEKSIPALDSASSVGEGSASIVHDRSSVPSEKGTPRQHAICPVLQTSKPVSKDEPSLGGSRSENALTASSRESEPSAKILDWIPPLSLGNDDELEMIHRFLNGSESSTTYDTAEEARGDDSSASDFVSLPTFTPPEYRFLESYMERSKATETKEPDNAESSTTESALGSAQKEFLPQGLKRMTTRELRHHLKNSTIREFSPLPPASTLHDPNDPNQRRSIRHMTASAFKKTCTMVMVPPMHLFILLVHIASRMGTKPDGRIRERERSQDLDMKKVRSMDMRRDAND